MNIFFQNTLVFYTDDPEPAKEICRKHPACGGFQSSEDNTTHTVFLAGPVEANEDLISKLCAL